MLLSACQDNKPGERESDDSTSRTAIPTVTRIASTSSGPATTAVTGFTAQFQDLLGPINAKCPPRYPELVTPLPEDPELKGISTETLMDMLESWNPSLRMDAAKALGERGPATLPIIIQGTHSKNHRVRAGSATALAAISNALPTGDPRSENIENCIRLMRDDVLEVRGAALKAMKALAPQTPEAALAVLAMCEDPDNYVAQEARLVLEKDLAVHNLPIAEIESGLKKALTGGPLPRGRGHIVSIIGRLKLRDQRRFTPELIAHLDWYPRRDTMFSSSGQAEAIVLLTQMEEIQLIERLPELMKKRGNLYDTCLESVLSFGKDAKIIIPELKAILNDLEANGDKARIRPRGNFNQGVQKLRTTIRHIDSL